MYIANVEMSIETPSSGWVKVAPGEPLPADTPPDELSWLVAKGHAAEPVTVPEPASLTTWGWSLGTGGDELPPDEPPADGEAADPELATPAERGPRRHKRSK